MAPWQLSQDELNNYAAMVRANMPPPATNGQMVDQDDLPTQENEKLSPQANEISAEDKDTFALANQYAELWNSFVDVGMPPSDHEIEDADADLEDSPWLLQQGDDGKWVVTQMPREDGAEQGTMQYSRDAGLRARIVDAAAETDRRASEAQKKAGNYRKGRVSLHGLTFVIENPKGSIRRGKDWKVVMKHHYGYLLKHESEADGDHVDVFLGPNPESEIVFVVDQKKLNGTFDEAKVMMGFVTEKEAKAAYLSNYSEGWKGFQNITPLTIDAFKEWLEHGDTGRAIAKQKIVLQHSRQARAMLFVREYERIVRGLDEVWQYAVRRAPEGGVTINGKVFRGGQFIPGEELKTLKEQAASGDAKAQEELGRVESTAAAQEATRQKNTEARGKRDVSKLKGKLEGHAGGEADQAAQKKATNSFRALKRIHGDLVQHRLDELADQTQARIEKVDRDLERTAAKKGDGTVNAAYEKLQGKRAELQAQMAHLGRVHKLAEGAGGSVGNKTESEKPSSGPEQKKQESVAGEREPESHTESTEGGQQPRGDVAATAPGAALAPNNKPQEQENKQQPAAPTAQKPSAPLSFNDRQSGQAWLVKTFGPAVANYDLSAQYGSTKYVSGAYKDVNSYLRGKGSGYTNPAIVKNIVRGMDDAFAHTKLPESVTAYRGIGADAVNQLKVGGTLQDKAFVSTSLSKAVAEPYTVGGGALLKINLPKGTPVVPSGIAAGTKGEAELTLQRDSQFKITGVEHDANGRPTYTVDLVPQGGAALAPDETPTNPTTANTEQADTEKPEEVEKQQAPPGTALAPSTKPQEPLPLNVRASDSGIGGKAADGSVADSPPDWSNTLPLLHTSAHILPEGYPNKPDANGLVWYFDNSNPTELHGQYGSNAYKTNMPKNKVLDMNDPDNVQTYLKSGGKSRNKQREYEYAKKLGYWAVKRGQEVAMTPEGSTRLHEHSPHELQNNYRVPNAPGAKRPSNNDELWFLGEGNPPPSETTQSVNHSQGENGETAPPLTPQEAALPQNEPPQTEAATTPADNLGSVTNGTPQMTQGPAEGPTAPPAAPYEPGGAQGGQLTDAGETLEQEETPVGGGKEEPKPIEIPATGTAEETQNASSTKNIGGTAEITNSPVLQKFTDRSILSGSSLAAKSNQPKLSAEEIHERGEQLRDKLMQDPNLSTNDINRKVVKLKRSLEHPEEQQGAVSPEDKAHLRQLLQGGYLRALNPEYPDERRQIENMLMEEIGNGADVPRDSSGAPIVNKKDTYYVRTGKALPEATQAEDMRPEEQKTRAEEQPTAAQGQPAATPQQNQSATTPQPVAPAPAAPTAPRTQPPQPAPAKATPTTTTPKSKADLLRERHAMRKATTPSTATTPLKSLSATNPRAEAAIKRISDTLAQLDTYKDLIKQAQDKGEIEQAAKYRQQAQDLAQQSGLTTGGSEQYNPGSHNRTYTSKTPIHKLLNDIASGAKPGEMPEIFKQIAKGTDTDPQQLLKNFTLPPEEQKRETPEDRLYNPNYTSPEIKKIVNEEMERQDVRNREASAKREAGSAKRGRKAKNKIINAAAALSMINSHLENAGEGLNSIDTKDPQHGTVRQGLTKLRDQIQDAILARDVDRLDRLGYMRQLAGILFG